MKEPSPEDFIESLENVFNTETGKVKIAADQFVFDVIHGIVTGDSDYEKVPARLTNGILVVALQPAYNAWVLNRRRRGEGSIEYRSLKVQLGEIHAQGGYITEPYKPLSIGNSVTTTFCVDVNQAADELETPKDINLDTIITRN